MNQIIISKKEYFIFLSAVGVSTSNAIHWTLSMMFTSGKMDINALYNQSGWLIGEGWIEAIGFAIIALYGWSALYNHRPNKPIDGVVI